MSVWCVFLAWSPSLNRVWGEVATRRNGADKLYGNMEGRIVSVELYGCIRDTLAYRHTERIMTMTRSNWTVDLLCSLEMCSESESTKQVEVLIASLVGVVRHVNCSVLDTKPLPTTQALSRKFFVLNQKRSPDVSLVIQTRIDFASDVSIDSLASHHKVDPRLPRGFVSPFIFSGANPTDNAFAATYDVAHWRGMSHVVRPWLNVPSKVRQHAETVFHKHMRNASFCFAHESSWRLWRCKRHECREYPTPRW